MSKRFVAITLGILVGFVITSGIYAYIMTKDLIRLNIGQKTVVFKKIKLNEDL